MSPITSRQDDSEKQICVRAGNEKKATEDYKCVGGQTQLPSY